MGKGIFQKRLRVLPDWLFLFISTLYTHIKECKNTVLKGCTCTSVFKTLIFAFQKALNQLFLLKKRTLDYKGMVLYTISLLSCFVYTCIVIQDRGGYDFGGNKFCFKKKQNTSISFGLSYINNYYRSSYNIFYDE